jgi:hypothetical protein
MDDEVVVAIVAVAVAVLVVVVAWLLIRQRRRAEVQERFGPEYDRAVAEHGDRRAAEKDLVDRRRRRDQLDIRPLPAGALARYSDEWRAIQARFVDQPESAITDADSLLDQLMRDRGYPVDDFGTKAELLSVDHPTVLDNYRAARAVQERNATRLASTEELRGALLRYRSLFEELLEVDTDTTTARKGTGE